MVYVVPLLCRPFLWPNEYPISLSLRSFVFSPILSSIFFLESNLKSNYRLISSNNRSNVDYRSNV